MPKPSLTKRKHFVQESGDFIQDGRKHLIYKKNCDTFAPVKPIKTHNYERPDYY